MRAFASLVVILAVALAGCGTTTQPSNPEITGVDVTPAPLNPTPWPNGTVGRFGVRVDPTLLKKLPSTVGGLPVVESYDLEVGPLDSETVASTVESFAYAYIGTIDDPDWAAVSVIRLKAESSGADAYPSLRDDYMQSACSQAGGIASQSTEQIADRSVDVATCSGGPTAYVLRLDVRTLVTALEMGPRQLGHQAIESIP